MQKHLNTEFKKAYQPQIRFWFCLDRVSDEEISGFLFYPNQFPTNHELTISWFSFENSNLNLISAIFTGKCGCYCGFIFGFCSYKCKRVWLPFVQAALKNQEKPVTLLTVLQM